MVINRVVAEQDVILRGLSLHGKQGDSLVLRGVGALLLGGPPRLCASHLPAGISSMGQPGSCMNEQVSLLLFPVMLSTGTLSLTLAVQGFLRTHFTAKYGTKQASLLKMLPGECCRCFYPDDEQTSPCGGVTGAKSWFLCPSSQWVGSCQ